MNFCVQNYISVHPTAVGYSDWIRANLTTSVTENTKSVLLKTQQKKGISMCYVLVCYIHLQHAVSKGRGYDVMLPL